MSPAPAGTGIALRLVRARPCVARVRWWGPDGRLGGDKRVHDATALVTVPAGTWLLDVEDDRSSHDPSRLAPARLEVQVRDGWRTAAQAHLLPGAVLTGSVRTAQDTRARWAEVEASGPGGTLVRTRTDGLGVFTLAGLGAGSDVLVSARSRWHQATPVLARPTRPAGPRLVLRLAQPLLGASRPGGTDPVVGGALRGVVLDADGERASYAAVVELRDARGSLLARTRTDRGGRFVVGGDLPAAAGLTVVVKSGPGDVVVDRVHLRGLAVGAGQLVDLGTVRMTRAARRPRPARASLPRATAAALRLPSTRV
ncbi:hypothetical protein NOK12_15500 [Nocardioides sp. OK12]|uniref:hypothetical protein n=1 Tax=Nocardioides sp. OK12 TaxID=2758661 RepID=UPI0021C2CDDF|nr:hypothetical protein [Nocardioides sp. OK12]GHJ59032.1 hypothetical protein NOK12_15500 [Nocardioides sp. OK12]